MQEYLAYYQAGGRDNYADWDVANPAQTPGTEENRARLPFQGSGFTQGQILAANAEVSQEDRAQYWEEMDKHQAWVTNVLPHIQDDLQYLLKDLCLSIVW